MMNIKYPKVGICGLSCRLCSWYHKDGENRCVGCKSEFRISAGCPFITCAVKKKGIEFCWECTENQTCDKWKNHREFSKEHDTFKCYQKLEDNISFIKKHGVDGFENMQRQRENVLNGMLRDFNEGRSKNYYCVASTVIELSLLEEALQTAKEKAVDLDIRERSKLLHSILDEMARANGYILKLRK